MIDYKKTGTTIFLISSIILLSIISLPAYASTKDELAQTNKAIEQSKEKQHQLVIQADKLKEELATLQESLVALAGSIQTGETALSDMEHQLHILSVLLQEKTVALSKEQKKLELLVMAALSLSRTPAEAMMMMPTGALESMKTARALAMASDDIRKQTQLIGKQVAELNDLKQKVAERRDALRSKQAALDKDRRDLESQVAQRTDLLQKLSQESRAEDEKRANLAKKAKDLKDLVASVEQEEEQVRQQEKQQKRGSGHALRSFVNVQGHVRPPPAVGQVVQSFGGALAGDAVSKGTTLRTRAGARVTNPYDGEVVFTGPFLAYGQMVIIRHGDGFHTLLAGLLKIDVEVGQFLLEGEPIGAMGDDESGNRLYIELRQNNQPVDPALWMSGLKKY